MTPAAPARLSAHDARHTSSALALAGHLAALEQPALERLLRTRVVAQPSRISDVFDLAEALLKPDSLRRALAETSRDDLSALVSSTPTPDAYVRALAILRDAQPYVLPEVTAHIDAMLEDRALTPDSLHNPVSERENRVTDTSVGTGQQTAENAFEFVRVASHVLQLIAEQPAELRNGVALTSSSLQRLTRATDAPAELATAAVTMLTARGVLVPSSAGLTVAVFDNTWRDWSRPRRYLELTSAWLRAAPADCQEALRQSAASLHGASPHALSLHDAHRAIFPLALPQQRERFAEMLNVAAQAGLVCDGRLTWIGARVVAETGAASDSASSAESELAELFPTSVPSFYLQPDLSIVAPGPLDLSVEETLVRFATLESAGLASSYRLSPRLVEEAFDSGMTAADIRSFLTEHSLTGIPQPVDYLLSEAERRHRSIVVRSDLTSQTTVVSVTEPTLLAQLLVDRALKPIALHSRDAHTAHTRIDAAIVTGVLRDAGYPASRDTVESTHVEGSQVGSAQIDREQFERNRLPSPPVDAAARKSGLPDGAAALIERVLADAANNPAAASFDRLLQYAVRHKQRLRVSMRQADGLEREFVLRPVGLGNGRLRGIDEAAEVERTLPVDQLITVEHVDEI